MFQRIKAAIAVLFAGMPEMPSVPVPSPVAQVKALFADPRFTWRSIEALHQASGLATIEQTRSLVLSMGAQRSELTREVYTMPFGTMPLSIARTSVTNPGAETQIRAALEDER